MKTAIAIIVGLIILGGGYYWYTNMTPAPSVQQATDNSVPETGTNTDMMQTNTGTVAPRDTSTDAPANVNVNATVNAGATVAATKEFTVTGSNYAFAPKTLSVNKGDTVKITFTNAGGMHDFVIDEFNVKTERLESGDSTTVTFVADKTGSFQYYCSVGKHRSMGMWGTLTVK